MTLYIIILFYAHIIYAIFCLMIYDCKMGCYTYVEPSRDISFIKK